jgi:hypothetical protein
LLTVVTQAGFHGSDGYHPAGVPAYVEGQQSSVAVEDTEDMSTINMCAIDDDNSFANGGMSIGTMSFN